jgi:hypothetical protein
LPAARDHADHRLLMVRSRAALAVLVLGVAATAWIACVGDSPTALPKGSEGGACYGDNTCNGDLLCVKDVCVRRDASAPPQDAGSDTLPPLVDAGGDAAKDGAACGPIPTAGPCGCSGAYPLCCLERDAGARCIDYADDAGCTTLKTVECNSDEQCGNRACCFKGDFTGQSACGTVMTGALDTHCEEIDASTQAGKYGCYIACTSDMHCQKYDAGTCLPFRLGASGEIFGVCRP